MQVLDRSSFTVSSNRRLFARRIPYGINLEHGEERAGIVEDALTGLAQLDAVPKSIILATFDDLTSSLKQELTEICGISNVEHRVLGSNKDLLGWVGQDSVLCLGTSSSADHYQHIAEPLANALIASGAVSSFHGAIQSDIGELIRYLPESPQLVRSKFGRLRVIDGSTSRQTVISRVRSFAGNLGQVPFENLKRQDRAGVCQLANFCVIDSQDGFAPGFRSITCETLRDQDQILGFSAIERICGEFSRFIKQSEQTIEGEPASIIIQINSYCVGSLIARKLKSSLVGRPRQITSPDVFIGWAPELTLLSQVTRVKSSAFMCLQRFPLVEFFYLSGIDQ